MKIILLTILFLTIALIIAFSRSRGHHRNGYSKQKRKVRTFITTERNTGIVGDGAWPMHKRSRETEPMGM